MLKLGSLFDDSGGFPLAADMCGIVPVWASEIEKFPIKVTTKRFPDMKHLGDITKINGGEIEPVDIITFGSPCQDLSVAGTQRGLAGERSGLFLEAIRVIKEMRVATNGMYPTIALWENVPGAFSSNKGEDFRTVLTEFCKICGQATDVPQPPKGKWNTCGCIMGDGFSVAWRVLDAQYWGVPQRRRRIFLVADFRGQRAPEILFKRNGLQRNFAESRKAWERTAAAAESSVRIPEYAAGFKGQNSVTAAGVSYCENQSPTLSAKQQVNCLCYACGNGQSDNSSRPLSDIASTLNCMHDPQAVLLFENHNQDSRYTGPLNVSSTITASCGTGGGKLPLLIEPAAYGFKGLQGAKAGNIGYSENKTPTIQAEQMTHCLCLAGNTIDREPENGGNGKGYQSDVSYTLDTMDRRTVVSPCNVDCRNGDISLMSSTLQARTGRSLNAAGVVCMKTQQKAAEEICRWIVRRLTPLECCRLQGFPDWWCDDIPHSDTAEYKMWGNGVALPCVLYVMEGIAEILKDGDEESDSL